MAEMGKTNSLIDRTKYGEGLYLLYFALMVGARALGLYEGMLGYNILLVVGMAIFLCKMIVTRHSFKEYLIAIILLLVTGIVYYHTGEKGLFVCFTMLLGMKGVSVKKVVETGALTAGIIVLSKIFLGVFGFTSEIYYPQDRAGVGVMFRHSLGYAHPNTLHMNVLMVSMMIIYIITVNHKAKKKNDIIVVLSASLLVFLFNLYVFQYSGSRTGILACLAYLFVNLWFYIRNNMGILEKAVSFCAFPVACFVAIVLPLIVDEKTFDFLDRTVFNSRFMLARYFWSNNSISLWGKRLNNPSEGLQTYGIDMAQLYLFLQLGLVAFCLMAAVTFWFISECIKHDRREELAVLMGMLFLGMWEPLLYNLGFKNFVYVFMGAMLYGVISGDLRSFEEGSSIFAGIIKQREQLDDSQIVGMAIKIVSIAIIVGAISSITYLFMTVEPNSLYGNREENEAGFSFGMDPIYLTEAQIQDIESSGDIVVGYVDETVPMYKYDASIADMEYNKKVMSVGVWTGFATAIITACLLWYNVVRDIKHKERSRDDK